MKTPISHPDSFQQTGKQPIILFALSLIFALSILLPDKCLAQGKEMYVEISEDGETLTFYFDENSGDKTTTTTYGIDEKIGVYPKWLNVVEVNTNYWETRENSYTTVKFDASFADARPTTCAHWFCNSVNLTKIEGIENLHTDDVTDMQCMFDACKSLTELDLSNFYTPKLENMYAMFGSCESLIRIDLSSFNTERVLNMSWLFADCKSLETITFGDNFYTSKVKDMSWMFHFCQSLKSIDVSGFDTKEVTNMFDMFGACESLTSLDVSTFNTSKVTDMCGMFNSCINLQELTFGSEFTTNKVTTMESMFYNCQLLKEIDLSIFTNTSALENISSMFSNCINLTSVDISIFNTDNVKEMRGLFSGCEKLTELDVSNFGTKQVVNMAEMFANCYSLENLTLGSLNTASVIDMNEMFFHCNSLKSLNLSSFNTASVTNMYAMFYLCTNLTSLNLSSFNTSSVTNMQSMFLGCNHLTSLTLGDNFITSKVENMSFMFEDCNLLPTLDLHTFDTQAVTTMVAMFQNCDNLKVLDLSSFNTSSVTDMSAMFYSCDLLTTILVNPEKWSISNLKDPSTSEDPYYSPFDECYNLIGDIGTKLPKDYYGHNNEYLKIDRPNDPGLLSTNSYKIFYDLDGDGTIDNVKQYEWEWESEPPLNFSIVRNSPIDIPNLKNQDGKTFIGWIGTPITGLDENDPQKNVRISDVAVGNRIYTAVWAEAYAVVSEDNSKLTFYFDNQKDKREGTSYRIDETQFLDNIGLTNFPKWIKLDKNQDGNPTTWTENPYERIIFDESFKNARPTSCFYWFNGCSKVKEIEGLQYLITDEVTNMDYMFTSCKSLTKLDLSHFNTEKVTEMNGMFYLCSGLQSLNVTSFNTENVADMCNMFIYCSNLSSLDLSSFNTEKVMNMAGMFNQCSNLNTLDLRTFNTSNDTTMEAMFWGCTNLTTILVSNNWNTSKVSPTNKIFADCKAIIGNEGTIFSDDKTTTEYARIDDLANNHPGYLTTESYKIFYDLDGDGKIDNVNQYEWEWESEPPLNFSIVRNAPIDIPNLKNQSGTSFIGWIGTPITGLNGNDPQKNVRISDVAVGNRIYTAVWEEQPINITIPDNLIYPEKPEENDDACNGNEPNVTLTITLPEGVNPSKYNLNIPDICNEEMDPTIVEYQRIFDIPISKETKPGRYDGIITLYFGEKGQLHEDSVHVTVAIDQNAILHLYEDVIFVNNHDSLYGGNGTYQWYHNDQEIPNATNQYLYDPNMSGVYKAKMYTTDGLEVYSCPIDEGKGLSKNSKLQVKTYPNPVVAGNEFTLEVAEYDPSANYTIHISNSNGVVVKEIANAAQFNTLTLNRGIYSGSITSGGRKQGFKLIVK